MGVMYNSHKKNDAICKKNLYRDLPINNVEL